MTTDEDERMTETMRKPRGERFGWRRGAAAGAVGSIVVGILLMAVDVEILSESIAGLYGQSGSLVVGWVVHLLHGTVFGVFFAGLLTEPILARVREASWKTVAAGGVYGILLAIFASGIIMPIWLTLVGVTGGGSIPSISVVSVAWHLLYGLVVGGAFAATE